MGGKKLSREDILIGTIWDAGKINLYSSVFERNVPFHMLQSKLSWRHAEHSISERLVQAVNDFLQLPLESKGLMQELLYRHCLACCDVTSYGFDVLDNETEMAANLRNFGVSNKEDAFDNAGLDHAMYVEEYDYYKSRFVTIMFYPRWEQEHGCELVLKDGELLDFFGENGTYLGQFDE